MNGRAAGRNVIRGLIPRVILYLPSESGEHAKLNGHQKEIEEVKADQSLLRLLFDFEQLLLESAQFQPTSGIKKKRRRVNESSDGLPIGHMGHVPRASRPGGPRYPFPPRKKKKKMKKRKRRKKKEKKQKRRTRKKGENEDIPMIVKHITKRFLFSRAHTTL